MILLNRATRLLNDRLLEPRFHYRLVIHLFPTFPRIEGACGVCGARLPKPSRLHGPMGPVCDECVTNGRFSAAMSKYADDNYEQDPLP